MVMPSRSVMRCLIMNSMKNNKIKEGKNPYEKKVGKNPLLKINFDNEISNEDIKIVEIPNIYSEYEHSHF